MFCTKINGKHRIWLIFAQRCMRVLFPCSAHKEYYRLHLVGLAATTLWGKGKLTCHAADVHQPPLGFSKKRQKFLRDFHGPEEVHGHASFVFSHGNEFPIGWKAKDAGIVDHSPQSWGQKGTALRSGNTKTVGGFLILQAPKSKGPIWDLRSGQEITSILTPLSWGFPGGPVVKTSPSNTGGCGFNPLLGN